MAVAASGSASRTVNVPNESLYIQNLPEKLQKEDLRRALYMLFSTHGTVLDVTALKTAKMRGQAHVLFRDERTAAQAMRNCQGFEFFGREMRISYSKNRSLTLQKMRGTFQPPGTAVKPGASTAQPSTSFPAPPGILPGPPKSLPPPPGLPHPPGLPQKPVDPSTLKLPTAVTQDAPSPQGVKRPRDDSDDDDAPMDEDDDDDGAMDMSDDD